METQTLFRSLLNLVGEPEYVVAKKLEISPASLSRHSQGLLRRRAVLQKAAEYFTNLVGAEIDPDLLQTEIDARTLLGVAIFKRSRRLRGIPNEA